MRIQEKYIENVKKYDSVFHIFFNFLPVDATVFIFCKKPEEIMIFGWIRGFLVEFAAHLV